MIIWC